MAKIPIWTGTATFDVSNNPTAFGFYDSDSDFQTDAPLVAKWCAQRLGYPLVDIELQDTNFFTAFEEAITEYGHQVYTFQIVNNLFRIKGNATGSALNQIYLDDYYGTDFASGNAGSGTGTSYNQTDSVLYLASLDVKQGTQKYNLLSSSPGKATATIEFNSTASVSSSYTLIDVTGASIDFTAHASSSTYLVSSSLGQFETGSTNIITAQNLADVITLNEQKLNANAVGSIVHVTQSFEGLTGNTSITLVTNGTNVTSSNFSGGSSGLNFERSGSSIQSGDKQIKIKKIYHYQPAAINRYFDPYAGTGTGIQSLMQSFGFGNYSPGVNFMLMPMYFDALKLQAIEMNDTIRKSTYHFEITAGQYIKLFPIPTRDYKLWFEYTMAASSVSPSITTGVTGEEEEKQKDLITDISNAPYERPIYEYINEPGRQWIRKYALALAKEMLGSVRGKYQSVPIPGDITTLDYSRLLNESSTEKEALISQLREDLEATTTLNQSARATDEATQIQQRFTVADPYQIYIH